ncbi:hypothetical protein BH20GEM2_BH20GEM2_13040 [soil metagenome]
MHPSTSVTDRLRSRVVNGLHLGHLHAGDRLASIREVAEEEGVDHRAVARAYRTLAGEGLVQVRGRSGVYVAPQKRFGRKMLEETARWMAGVVADGWQRRITIPELPDLVRRCTASVHLRCGCVESDDEHLTALGGELEREFGLEVRRVRLRGRVAASGVSIVPEIRGELEGLDLIVTTAFHAALVRREADALGIPLVVATVNPENVAAAERRLRRGPLTVVCVDPQFGERARAIRDGAYRDRIRVVLADDARALALLDRSEEVVLTQAARARLGDDAELPLLVPLSPSISPESARELAEAIIRLNLEAEND